MLENEGVLIGKYPCNRGRIYINSNLYLYASTRNGLYEEFIKNDKNRKQARGLCIPIFEIEETSNIPCKYKLVPIKIIDQYGHSYSSSERTSPNGIYRNIKLHIASPILFDYDSKEHVVFLSILYGSDIQHIRFSIVRINGKWTVIETTDWWVY